MMSKAQRTRRELERGLRQWVADYNLACRYGNSKLAGGIRRNIDNLIAVCGLDERLVYKKK